MVFEKVANNLLHKTHQVMKQQTVYVVFSLTGQCGDVLRPPGGGGKFTHFVTPHIIDQ